MATSLQSYLENIMRVGSSNYYAFKNLTAEVLRKVQVVLAFYDAIETILLTCTDYTVAHTKLNWWRHELAKLTAEHPLAQVLQSIGVEENILLEVIDNLEEPLHALPFSTMEFAMLHWMRTVGLREKILMKIILQEHSVQDEMLYQLALVIGLSHYIQHLRKFVRQGLIYFSKDECEKYGVDIASFQHYKTTPVMQNLLAAEVAKIERAYGNVCSSLSFEQYEKLSPWMIRCNIALKTIEEIKKSGYTVLENFMDLTPLRKWWVSWRTKKENGQNGVK